MVWKSTSEGVTVKGKIASWFKDFKRWYSEDVPEDARITEMSYIFHMTLVYANMAKERWAKELLGRSKIRRLDSFVDQVQGGGIQVNVWDTLDFLAERLDGDVRSEWAKSARHQTRKLLHLA